MSSKFFKVIFVAMLSIGLIGQANASLIVGDIVLDSDGVEWAYAGSYNLAGGPSWIDADGSCSVPGADMSTCWMDYATPVNGIEAADLLFTLAAGEVFAISTSQTLVDHLAFYDEFSGSIATAKSESFIADADGDGLYNTFGDASAYINDRAGSDIINYVFKSIVDVPAPSTLAIFAFTLCAFGARRLKA